MNDPKIREEVQRKLSKTPLGVGDEVMLWDGTRQTISKINSLGEAVGESDYYIWETNGEIAHAAMDPEKCTIFEVYRVSEGPWQWYRFNEEENMLFLVDDEKNSVMPGVNVIPGNERTHNMILIESSQELLCACEQLIHAFLYGSDSEHGNAIVNAQSLIHRVRTRKEDPR